MGRILSGIVGCVIGGTAVAGVMSQTETKQKEYYKKLSDKHLKLYLLMNEWVKVKQNNKLVEQYLEKEGYKKIAIYGMNFVGETLLRELEGTNITVVYGIDKNAANLFADIDLITPEEEFEPVDAIIVTPITFFNEIERELSTKVDCPIISIEDIIYDL